MNNKTFIPYRLPGLNEYTNANRGNRYGGANLKKVTESLIFPFVAGLDRFKGPVKIMFIWHEKNKKRDIDNVAFAKKFVLDSLVSAGVLLGDSPKYVRGFSDGFIWGEDDGVEIIIEEIN